MRCERYRGMDGPLVRDQDIPLLKKGEKGRRAMERELGKKGHRKGWWHMVIVKSLWRGPQEHTVAPEAVGFLGASSHSPRPSSCAVPGLLDCSSSDDRLHVPCPASHTPAHSLSCSRTFFPRRLLPRLPALLVLPCGLTSFFRSPSPSAFPRAFLVPRARVTGLSACPGWSSPDGGCPMRFCLPLRPPSSSGWVHPCPGCSSPGHG